MLLREDAFLEDRPFRPAEPSRPARPSPPARPSLPALRQHNIYIYNNKLKEGGIVFFRLFILLIRLGLVILGIYV